MAGEPKHLQEEADIGSGEKSPGERETEEEIQRIQKSPTNKPGAQKGMNNDVDSIPPKGN